MPRSLQLILMLLCAIILNSCGEKFIYFQQKKDSKNTYQNIQVSKPSNPLDHMIEAGDMLGLKINTSNPLITEEFTKYLTNGGTPSGLLVQENGTIFLPYTGSMNITGKTITEAEKMIAEELEKHIVNPKIELSLNAFRITVLGEVKLPGIKYSPGDRMTILDALSLSGDLGPDGKRSNIKVIRQVGDKKTVTFVDVSSVDIFSSESFYLKSNDIVYVETLPRRFVRENSIYLNILLTLLNTVIIFVRIK